MIMDIFFNGEKLSSSELAPIVRAIEDPAVLREKGGFLFRFAREEETVHFGLLPYLQNGQRMYHYNIKMPSFPLILSGFVNAGGSLTFLPEQTKKKDAREWLSQDYHNQVKFFASFLINEDFPPKTRLDEISVEVLDKFSFPWPGQGRECLSDLV